MKQLLLLLMTVCLFITGCGGDRNSNQPPNEEIQLNGKDADNVGGNEEVNRENDIGNREKHTNDPTFDGYQ